MKIIGINGLGVVPSACLLADGKLIAFAEEERFTRLKGSFGMMPGRAAKFCLDFAGLKLEDIDYIAFGWDCNLYRFYMPLFIAGKYLTRSPKAQGSSNIFKVAEELVKYQPSNVTRLLTEMFRTAGVKGKIPPIEFVPHHLAHAASAFYTSGFDKAHILVIDGSGENRCTTILKGEGTNLTMVKSFKIPDSLGWFYQSITEFLGFMPNRHEGKVMALASYGVRDETILGKMKQMISYDSNGDYRYHAEYCISGHHDNGKIYSEQMVELLGPPRFHGEPIMDTHRNIAFAAQLVLEEIATNMVRAVSSMQGYNGNICIAGGVGLNCKMNGAIAALPEVKDIFVPPVSNDAGTALGAAMYLSNKKNYDPRFKMEHAYWGPAFSNGQIKQTLTRSAVRFTEEPNIELTTAKLLAENKIVGWFQGRMEAGSRALGARSILASPLPKTMRDTINEKVKGRENWRPFAASILDEEKHKYIAQPKQSPFMALAFKVTDEMAEKIPSAVHIDSTTRPQFVTKQTNARYWNLINEFGKLTGVYALLNTSLNTNEEPIVCTPEQALRAFYASGMDYLAIDNFLLHK
jgi:carbamoyltransferase